MTEVDSFAFGFVFLTNNTKGTNLFDSSPKVAAGLFKRWLNILPDPVISPPTLRDDFLALYEAEFSQQGASNNQFDFLKSMIFKLPTMHRWLLKDCILFLTNAIKSTMNSYTSLAIATIFGPIFFRASPETPYYSISIAITDYLFANAASLFSVRSLIRFSCYLSSDV